MRLRTTARGIVRAPFAYLPKALVLGFGVGCATLGFGLVEAFVLRPLPFQEPNELVTIEEVDSLGQKRGGSLLALEHWRAQKEIFSGVAGYRPHDLNLTGSDRPLALFAASVTADFFSLLQQRAHLGRVFTKDETEGTSVVVLSYNFWMNRFGGSDQAIGAHIALAGRAHRIVGILPKEFRFLNHLPDVFVPLGMRPSNSRIATESNLQIVVARLQPSATSAQALQVTRRDESHLAELYPNSRSGWTTAVVSLHEKWMGRTLWPAIIMFSAVGILLVISCVNSAGLILAQSIPRRGEVAIRLALGANWSDVAKDRLAESAFLAGGTILIGIALASVGFLAFRAVVPSDLAMLIPEGAAGFRVDWLAVAFASFLSALTAVVCSVSPLLQELGTSHSGAFRGADVTSRRAERTRQVLAIGQVALSIVLLMAGGLLLKGFWLAQNTPLGFESSNFIAMWVGLEEEYFTKSQRLVLYDKVVGDLSALPGIETATVTNLLPTHEGQELAPYATALQSAVNQNEWPVAGMRSIGSNYFEALGVRVTDGRAFDSRDRSDSMPVAIVSESLARSRFAGNPIGQNLRVGAMSGGPPVSVQIIGVVADVRVPLQSSPVDLIYRPLRQTPSEAVYFLARSQRPEFVLSATRKSLWELAPEQPMEGPWLMEEEISHRLAMPRFSGALVGGMAAGALFLACLGIYATISNLVASRKREIGIRMAVGATAMDVRALVFGHALRLVLIGLTIGLTLAAGATRFLEPYLLGVSRFDETIFAGVSLLILIVSAAATLLPAVRATQIDPNRVLKAN